MSNFVSSKLAQRTRFAEKIIEFTVDKRLEIFLVVAYKFHAVLSYSGMMNFSAPNLV